MQEWRNVGWFLRALGSLLKPNLCPGRNRPVLQKVRRVGGGGSESRPSTDVRFLFFWPCDSSPPLMSVCLGRSLKGSPGTGPPVASPGPGSSILEDPALSSPLFSFWSPDFLSCSSCVLQEAPPSQPRHGENGFWKMSIHPIRTVQEALTSCWPAVCFRRLIAYLGWNSWFVICTSISIALSHRAPLIPLFTKQIIKKILAFQYTQV